MTATTHRVEIAVRDPGLDVEGAQALRALADEGIGNLQTVRSVKVYVLTGTFAPGAVERAAREFLADPVTEIFSVDAPVLPAESGHVLEIARKPGVMEPVETSVLRGCRRLEMDVDVARVARRYLVHGDADAARLRDAALKRLANGVIETVAVDGDNLGPARPSGRFVAGATEPVHPVPLAGLHDEALADISRRGGLSLSLAEMRAIQKHFAALGREPVDIELETIAQTWSEHCNHKTFRGLIRYSEDGRPAVHIDNLLKSTVARATRELDRDWCWSVFEDNAGVIALDDATGLAFKVETHNHPSALEPYGGAGTGTGGCIRDPMGTGLGGKPILNTDVFCLAPPDMPADEIPAEVLSPARVLRGVVAGVRDYGNRMGIPTANGALAFDKRYLGNPLVFCGCLATIPREFAAKRKAQPGQLALAVGGRTGRDGIHGATFSSIGLDAQSGELSSGAVQIGNPIEQKKVLDFLLRARDAGLYSVITDCGAGGFSSALGEMGAEIGVAVDLEQAPLKYEGLTPTEIWISEAQERMVIATDADKLPALRALADEEEVELTRIAVFADDKTLRLRWHGREIGTLAMDFLHDGCPRVERFAVWAEPGRAEPSLPERADFTGDLARLLASWNIGSKEPIVRQYDHEVQALSVVKPFVGVASDGPGDATVMAPLLGVPRFVAVGCGLCPSYADIDPYWMAAAAIDEALRNVVAVGASLDRCAILDNFCWGDCEKPDRLGGLVRAAQACYDFAVAFGTPFISGKDSLNNEFGSGDDAVAIPGTLLISALALLPEGTRPVTMDAKAAGHKLYMVGPTRDELGASRYYALHNEIGRNVPRVDVTVSLAVFSGLAAATKDGCVRSLHDCSEGGLAVAAAEMAFAGGLGITIDLDRLPIAEPQPVTTAARLFSESASRLLAEVAKEDAERFEAALAKAGAPFARVGEVTGDGRVVFTRRGRHVIDGGIADLKEAWQAPMRELWR